MLVLAGTRFWPDFDDKILFVEEDEEGNPKIKTASETCLVAPPTTEIKRMMSDYVKGLKAEDKERMSQTSNFGLVTKDNAGNAFIAAIMSALERKTSSVVVGSGVTEDVVKAISGIFQFFKLEGLNVMKLVNDLVKAATQVEVSL